MSPEKLCNSLDIEGQLGYTDDRPDSQVLGWLLRRKSVILRRRKPPLARQGRTARIGLQGEPGRKVLVLLDIGKKPQGFLPPREKSPIVAACPPLEWLRDEASEAGLLIR